MARVVLAMSGGVDSSVAAHLLLDAGHEVIGVFMRHGEESSRSMPGPRRRPRTCRLGCPCLAARKGQGTNRVAAPQRMPPTPGVSPSKLGIPFYAIDLQQDFRRIVDYFVDDYLNGRTPNPCVKCNHWIKFGRLFDYADGVDAEFVATGHYARMIDGQLASRDSIPTRTNRTRCLESAAID